MPDQPQNQSPKHMHKKSFFAEILSLPNDSTKKTVFVALVLCLICSILVSTAAVALKPLQLKNKEADIKQNILAVAGINPEGKNIDEQFKQFDVKVVDLNTGEYVDNIDPDSYDQRKAAADPALGVPIPGEKDIAKIGRRSKYAKVYLLREGDEIKQIILPIHGYGLWSTLYGFIALEKDANTIKGIKFYEQAETPGLGGEVDNPKWQAKWIGKKVFDDKGNLRFEVIRGQVVAGISGSEYQVDGLSGATLTSRGVSNMVKFWLGEDGFGPFLKKFRSRNKTK